MRYILSLAAAFRLYWLYARYDHLRYPFHHIEQSLCDSCEYVNIAQHLPYSFSLAGSVTAFRAPFYPLFVFVFFHPLAVGFAQIILSLITCWLVYLIGRRFSPRVGIVSASLFALAPLSSQISVQVLSETLFTFLVVVGIYFWTDRPVLSGLAFGLGILTRPLLLPFSIVLLVLGIKQRPLVLVGLVSLLTVLPWTIRNAIVFEEFIPVSTGGMGLNLYVGTMDLKYGTGDTLWAQIVNSEYTTDYYSRDKERALRRKAIDFIVSKPLEWLRIRIRQYPRLFMDGQEMLPGGKVRQFSFLIGNLVLLILAVVSWRKELYLISFPLFLALIHIPLWTDNRYSLPMMPMVIILAVLGARKLLLQGQRSPRVSAIAQPLNNWLFNFLNRIDGSSPTD